ncbi:hypothetical protein P692DRAFT_20874985 [Suillus brevipes Sb2]|nr:hypothetical protein P692DRAFT_20874985 [Suillus brevipes Sb2]
MGAAEPRDHLLPAPSPAPSSAPSSPSPQYQQRPQSLIPSSHNQRSPAPETTPYNYGHGRALPPPSYGQHLDMPQGPGGSDTAGYSHTQYTPRNDMYPHLAPHHANVPHAEAYDSTHAPAHQQRLEDYDTRALVPSQQQQYPEIYGCAPARAPSEQQQHMENYGARAPAPGYDKQQHMENYGARAPALTYDTRVPAPQQGLVAHRDGRVAYNMDEHWQPHYRPMAHQAENVLQTPRRSSQRTSPLPGLVAYSSSPPQSEGN